MLSRLFSAALWSSAGKGLASWLSFLMYSCVFVTFPCGILGQVWDLIVSIPDLCPLSYLDATILGSSIIKCVNSIVSGCLYYKKYINVYMYVCLTRAYSGSEFVVATL